MVKRRASRKFIVKRLNGRKVSHVVVKIRNCSAWHYITHIIGMHCTILINKEFSFGERFLAVLGPQNPLGSCAARNVQNFGGATCKRHCQICSWWWIMNMACRDGWKNSLKQPEKAIFFYTPGQIGENNGRELCGRKFWKNEDFSGSNHQIWISFCPAPV